ncbi:hypothetical protein V6N13_147439 [Hibiscus sabdariffa]|uniref:Uncharacterized protein n=1 Tax=Hibiscus sabdariffa TaxID=183260 RepID=A0ABR2TVL5_9ROSI
MVADFERCACRTGPPRGGEVDPYMVADQRQELATSRWRGGPNTSRPAQASQASLPTNFSTDQATSRWRGATGTVQNGLFPKLFGSQPYNANYFRELAHRANFALGTAQPAQFNLGLLNKADVEAQLLRRQVRQQRRRDNGSSNISLNRSELTVEQNKNMDKAYQCQINEEIR